GPPAPAPSLAEPPRSAVSPPPAPPPPGARAASAPSALVPPPSPSGGGASTGSGRSGATISQPPASAPGTATSATTIAIDQGPGRTSGPNAVLVEKGWFGTRGPQLKERAQSSIAPAERLNAIDDPKPPRPWCCSRWCDKPRELPDAANVGVTGRPSHGCL